MTCHCCARPARLTVMPTTQLGRVLDLDARAGLCRTHFRLYATALVDEADPESVSELEPERPRVLPGMGNRGQITPEGALVLVVVLTIFVGIVAAVGASGVIA